LRKEAEGFALQYNRTVIGGEIIEGQGTSTVEALPKNDGGSIIVTLEVGG